MSHLRAGSVELSMGVVIFRQVKKLTSNSSGLVLLAVYMDAGRDFSMNRFRSFLLFLITFSFASWAFSAETKAEESQGELADAANSSTVFVGEASHLQRLSMQSRARAKEEVNALFLELQQLKEDVIDLNKDLHLLEEALLFPANTQLVVFVSLDVGEFFRLESVKLKLDGEMVAAHLYTGEERDALYSGGTQKLFIGNVSPGKHEVTALFTGKGPQGQSYKRGASLRISKASGPKYIELAVTDSQSRLQPEFAIKEW